jgi:hypothetical protein
MTATLKPSEIGRMLLLTLHESFWVGLNEAETGREGIMIHRAVLGAAALVLVEFVPRPSAAAIYYPWCAQLDIRDGGRTCAFVTKAQCMASLGGIGGFCYQNPNPPSVYQSSAVPSPPSPQRRPARP